MSPYYVRLVIIRSHDGTGRPAFEEQGEEEFSRTHLTYVRATERRAMEGAAGVKQNRVSLAMDGM